MRIIQRPGAWAFLCLGLVAVATLVVTQQQNRTGELRGHEDELMREEGADNSDRSAYHQELDRAVKLKAEYKVAEKEAAKAEKSAADHKLVMEKKANDKALQHAMDVHKEAAYMEVKKAARDERQSKAQTKAAQAETKAAAQLQAKAATARKNARLLAKKSSAYKQAAATEVQDAANIKMKNPDDTAKVFEEVKAMSKAKAAVKRSTSSPILSTPRQTLPVKQPRASSSPHPTLSKGSLGPHPTLSKGSLRSAKEITAKAQAAGLAAEAAVARAKAAKASVAAAAGPKAKQLAEKEAQEAAQNAQHVIKRSALVTKAANGQYKATVGEGHVSHTDGKHNADAVVSFRKIGQEAVESAMNKVQRSELAWQY